ncbi:MAG: UDP-N-acetylmuramoyl-L-alanyl-D-glutamate--2,6-diaminopimelate ligase [Acidobacteria bacterium]|nr:UDP-N-acetylmuramoyl-L-alanyl-D-glutamate--2,6-diaminopimelate ligase [Acidobacteriota bacterium]
MILADVIARVPGASSAAVDAASTSQPVAEIAYDSRRVAKGAVFVALRGLKADGAAFAAQAISRGAIAVVAESPRPAEVTVPWIQTPDARLALALLADAFFDSPSRRMPVIGVTGTNGKTTTAYLLSSILDAAGMTAGVMGTVSYRIGREEREAARTTPEAPDVQRLLTEMIEHGCRSAVMEVSSHALALRRVDGMRFAAGIFTNLTRDHLDFHPDMESYFAAKRRLFEMLDATAPGIINVDDPRGASLVTACQRPVTYGLTQPADVTAGPLDLALGGLTLDVRTPRGSIAIRSRLVGRPNVYNILAAAATAMALDVPLQAIAEGVHALPGVPGRFEVVSTDADDITVVVDYAHTDDALRNLMETARPLAARRLITVFGCGGDRDRTKRPLMGMVAARLSDVVIITSDNPRSEDPARIIDEVRRGITPGAQGARRTEVHAVVDRGEAIERAITMAGSDDLILVAGKGHEKYQQIGDRVLPFDDVAVAQDALARRQQRRSKAV